MADYFSRLTEPLIHHILSFLPFDEIGRTCVLSKYFNTIWSNYPNLDFSFSDPYRMETEEEEDIFDRMENSLGQCLLRRSFIQQLSLKLFCFRANNLITKLDDWLGQSIDKNVSRLVLTLYLRQELPVIYYSVPHQVLVSRRLEVLDLCGCIFKEDSFDRIELPCVEKLRFYRCEFVGDMNRIVHIELPRLEELSLSSCQFVDDNLLQKILCAGPKIQDISLKGCRGLENSLSVSCTPLLKHFLLRCDNEFERIKIDAPSLHTFSCEARNDALAIDLNTCTNLKELYLHNIVGTVFVRNMRISQLSDKTVATLS